METRNHDEEIERKFILVQDKIPDFLCNELSRQITLKLGNMISQNYLAITEQEEQRIRKITSPDGRQKYFQTYKRKTDSEEKRIEKEFEISKELYEILNSKITERPVLKTRYKLEWLDYVMEIDIYEDSLTVTEIEFESEEAAKTFIVPDWLIEVTKDKKFGNKNIWLKINAK